MSDHLNVFEKLRITDKKATPNVCLESAKSIAANMSTDERVELVMSINGLNLAVLSKLEDKKAVFDYVQKFYGWVVPRYLRFLFFKVEKLVEWSFETAKMLIDEVKEGTVERTIYATLGIIETDPVNIIDQLFLHSELDLVLTNVLAVTHSDVRDTLYNATKTLFEDTNEPYPRQTARLLHCFSTAIKDSVEKPNVSAAYYKGFSFSYTSSSGAELAFPEKMGKLSVSTEYGYTWTPVPMLEALSAASEFELTRFYRAFLRRIMWYVLQWTDGARQEFEDELRQWVNVEADVLRLRLREEPRSYSQSITLQSKSSTYATPSKNLCIPYDEESSEWVYSLENARLAEVATSLLGLIGACKENLKKAGKEQGYWVLPTDGDYTEYNRCIKALQEMYGEQFPFVTIDEPGKVRPRSAAWLGTQCKGILAFIWRNLNVKSA